MGFLLQSYPNFPLDDPEYSTILLKHYTVDQACAMLASAYYLDETPGYAYSYGQGLEFMFNPITNQFPEYFDFESTSRGGYSDKTQAITTYCLFLYHTQALNSAFGVFSRDLARRGCQPLLAKLTPASGYLIKDSSGAVDTLTNIWTWFMLRAAIDSFTLDMMYGGMNEGAINDYPINDIPINDMEQVGSDLALLAGKIQGLEQSIRSLWNGVRFPSGVSLSGVKSWDDTLTLTTLSGLFWSVLDEAQAIKLLAKTDTFLRTISGVSGYVDKVGDQTISIESTILRALLQYKIHGKTLSDLTVLAALNARQSNGSWRGSMTPSKRVVNTSSVSSTVWPVLYYYAKQVLFT